MEKAGSAVTVKKGKATGTIQVSAVARSILGALAYADLFDYPLTLAQVYRYQIGTLYTQEQLAAALTSDLTLARSISRSPEGFYSLASRETVFVTRREREAASAKIWRRARLYSRFLSHFPFVRMVAVTGALAVDNIADNPDIDLLVVTLPGRVWIARRLIVGLVRLARLWRDDLCPNYIISRDNLTLDQRDLFTAHELAQMIPLYGLKLYERMISQNEWANEYLPAAFTVPRRASGDSRPGILRKGIEWVLALHLLDGWERWELNRLRHKLRPKVGESAEVICSPTQCKGHTGLHRHWVTTRYEQRIHELNLE
ncbi:MAG TPA: hypothetical protein VLQ48_17530 [Chloroflexia bacterium]|nr:hypothetical protein [Chloroflexia bacterium]